MFGELTDISDFHLTFDYDLSTDFDVQLFDELPNLDFFEEPAVNFENFDEIELKTEPQSPSSMSETNSISSSDESWGRGEKQQKKRKMQNRKSPNVAHWLWDKLQDPNCRNLIEFTDIKNGEFRICDQDNLAKLWGNRPGKTNKKMSSKDFA